MMVVVMVVLFVGLGVRFGVGLGFGDLGVLVVMVVLRLLFCVTLPSCSSNTAAWWFGSVFTE